MAYDRNKHRVFLGWLYVGMAMLLAVFLVFTWKKVFGAVAATHAQEIIRYTLAIATLYFTVGLTLLLDYRHAAWICLPFSIVMLVSFPVGTLLGGYYLWYFWKFVYRQQSA
ncbi:MAG TPA: hypothetical protein VGD24_04760 [Gallionella sp.]